MTLTSRHYDNAADMLAGAHAVRMRLLRPKNAFRIVEALPAPVAYAPPPADLGAPLWTRQATHFDAHVRHWEWRLANPGGDRREFVARRCEELGLKHSDFVGSSQKAGLTGKRQIIWYELRLNFNLSYPQIGAMSGGRDHSTILSGVRRIAKIMDAEVPGSLSDAGRLSSDRELNDRMRREYAKGATQADLAEKYGLSLGAIQKVAQLEKWPRECQEVAKRYDLAGIFDAYYAGWPIRDITEKFQLPERTLRGLRQRFGWAKRGLRGVQEKKA
ncbi:hypothetical protein LAV84_18385 [Rhizobium sp. VS19-DR104.2]|uniref:helix-turn-helix domain-containing protein n=1 Tax=unclassified Rhizobium TaxID=2613769 RepID=UPI001CC6D296|nr:MULTISPECIES: helix-turn-helix domain-containing protein [unclassified Rhizobium]MBZ5761565.1 hypothetical protein [Rhizobium sp. VS19-DR96]MBZ5767513.1 hypothetical protein [Rhizobium sp. VS19-DR129.2]MBZ5775038.1 hypothetical protein [Rhizobium sp. VS19-DRK62.2]MBZ5785997.1 hypothetical protein [Rhizobium sp. VS19-DR121]MBZ5803423.1 hypothetical protein [Rhizobium sp. VS19-DR181]